MLLKSLYGTRDASANFQAEVAKLMISLKFKRSRYNPSTYYHEKWKVRCMIHGDDFISVGGSTQLREFRTMLEKRFEISTLGTRRKKGKCKKQRC